MIKFVDSCGSTQDLLIRLIKSGEATPPYAVLAGSQYSGKGSRGSGWEDGEGNLFLSFALPISAAPAGMPLASASIWFAFRFVEFLRLRGSNVWLKWPNDIYLNDSKIGGVITSKTGEVLICGIGVNLKSAPKIEGAGVLDIDIAPLDCAGGYLAGFGFDGVSVSESWAAVWQRFSVEFEKSRHFNLKVFQNGEKITKSLKNAILQPDGSIIIDGEQIFSSR